MTFSRGRAIFFMGAACDDPWRIVRQRHLQSPSPHPRAHASIRRILPASSTSTRGFAMTYKILTFEFVVPTAMAAALAVMLSIVAVYLTDKYLGPIEQAEGHYSVGGSN
jgi:hypothetical protein